jgi:hypothetical protein
VDEAREYEKMKQRVEGWLEKRKGYVKTERYGVVG